MSPATRTDRAPAAAAGRRARGSGGRARAPGRPTRRTSRDRTPYRAAFERPGGSPRRAARRARRRARARSGPRAAPRRDAASRRPRGSRGPVRTRGSARSRARSRRALAGAGAALEARRKRAKVRERLEGHALGRKPVGEPIPREDAVSRQRDAAVRVPVAHVNDFSVLGKVLALARLPASAATMLGAEEHPPAVRTRVESVRPELDRVEHSLPFEQRLDRLVEAARDDQRPPLTCELSEPGPDLRVLEQPLDYLLERRRHRRELRRDHLVQSHRLPERTFDPRVDPPVAELLEDEVERVHLGDGAVPVQY